MEAYNDVCPHSPWPHPRPLDLIAMGGGVSWTKARRAKHFFTVFRGLSPYPHKPEVRVMSNRIWAISGNDVHACSHKLTVYAHRQYIHGRIADCTQICIHGWCTHAYVHVQLTIQTSKYMDGAHMHVYMYS